MIAITHLTSGAQLHLSTGERLTFEQAAGWLADEDLPGGFSYPIKFPLDHSNDAFLQYGYRPDIAVPIHDIPVLVELHGMVYRKCTLSYRVTDGAGDGYLKIDSGEVYDKLKSLSLLDALPDAINLGGSGQPLSQRMNAIVTMTPGTFPVTFFPIRNELFFEEDLSSDKVTYTRQSYVNVYTKTGFKVDSDSAHGFLAVPQLYLSWVITRLFESIGYRVTGDWLGNPEVQRLVVFNQTAMVTTAKFLSVLKGFQLTAGMHLPDMSVADFLKAIRQRYGLIYTFNANTRTASIRRFADVVKTSRPQNLTPFQLASYSIDAPDLGGFTIYDYVDEADELYKDPVTGTVIKPAPLVIGKGKTEIQLKCGTTQLIYDNSPLSPGARWLVPTVRQAGNVLDPYYQKSDRALQLEPGETTAKRKYNVGLKILSYRGITQDSMGNSYPLATPDVRNGRQEVVGKEAQTLLGPYGIWRNLLRGFYYFRDNTRKVVANTLLPVAQVGSLQFDQTVQLSLEGNVLASFLPNKLQAEAPGMSGLLYGKLEALTIPAGLDLAPDPTEIPVWVELIQKREEIRTSGANSTNRLLAYGTKLDVRIWADRNKTAPAVANALQLNIRRGTTTSDIYNNSTYSENIVVYIVSGSSALLEQGLVEFVDPDATGKPTVMKLTNLLDPGAGYNII